MSKSPSIKDTTRFLESLRQSQKSESDASGQNSHPELAVLRQWQANRMTETYADLLADRRFAPACRFFIDEVQAPLELSQLTHDLERMYDMSLKFLPSNLLSPLAMAIELNTLTRELDLALLAQMLETDTRDTPDAPFAITPEFYADAYRQCNNQAERITQVELIGKVGQGIERVARIPLVDVTLRLARGPAQQAGWRDLQDFLERGLKAFKRMGWSSGRFLRTFTTREKQIVEQLYAGAEMPFRVKK